MGTRHKARELAVQLLYQMDITGDRSSDSQEVFWKHFHVPSSVKEFSSYLVQGVLSHLTELDNVIATSSAHWRLGRMGKVDLNILRIGTFELLHCPETPRNVSINEAIEMAKRLAGEESGTFVNGILDHVASLVEAC